jgi:hypothetical protein
MNPNLKLVKKNRTEDHTPTFNVCIGSRKNTHTSIVCANKKFQCILCQEEEVIKIDSPPMVLCCYVQR